MKVGEAHLDDGCHSRTPIDLSLDDDTLNEEDINNSDEHSDSSSSRGEPGAVELLY